MSVSEQCGWSGCPSLVRSLPLTGEPQIGFNMCADHAEQRGI